MTYYEFRHWGSPEFEEALALSIQDTYAFREWTSEELNLPAEYEDIHLDLVEEVSVSYEQEADVRQLSDSKRLVSIEAHLVCNFDVFIYKPDYIFVEDDPRLSIVNPYWNKRYMRGEITLRLRSEIMLVLGISDSEWRRLEVLSVTPVFADDDRLEMTSRRRRFRR